VEITSPFSFAATPMTMISTKRLQLRPLHEGDTDGLVRGLNNFNVSKWTARVPFPYGMADAKSFLALCQKAEQDTLRLAITIDGELIGVISYERSQDGISAELGYWLAEPHWGQGYGTEAARAVSKHAFEAGGLDMLIAGYAKGNEGSRRILEGLGFEPTGELMQFSAANNANVPVVRLALAKGRWQAMEGRRS